MARGIEYFMNRIAIDANGCWLWQGEIAHNGYGRIIVSDVGESTRRTFAHRWAHEHFTGPIPESYQVDHLCKVRRCANPEHLEAVTGKVNNLRSCSPSARNAVKTHCARGGHPLSGDNLYVCSRGKRECRTCRNDRTAEWNLKRRMQLV